MGRFINCGVGTLGYVLFLRVDLTQAANNFFRNYVQDMIFLLLLSFKNSDNICKLYPT